MKPARFRVLAALALAAAVMTAAPPARGHDPHAPATEDAVPLIVDSDMGMDDVRALILLLQSPRVKIHGFVSVFGSVGPQKGAENFTRILGAMDARHMPVAVGAKEPLERKFDKPPWRPMCEAALADLWGDADYQVRVEPGHRMLARLIRELEGEARVICLGPLTDLALALQEDPDLAGAVHTLVIGCAGTGGEEAHWNIATDPEAARLVLAAPFERVVLVPPPRGEEAVDFSRVLDMVESEGISGRGARTLSFIYREEAVHPLLEEGHFRLWDELAALQVIEPDLFTLEGPFCAGVRTGEEIPGLLEREDGDGCAVMEAVAAVPDSKILRTYLDILAAILPADDAATADSGEAHGSGGVMLNGFPPAGGATYLPDVAPFARRVVERHGAEEWRWAVLASEIHSHLGIYSLVGVKMGLRALEILGAPRAEVTVTPHCGTEPPLSCLQDGLMVATGSTPGRGLLMPSTSSLLPAPMEWKDGRFVESPVAGGDCSPSATFRYKGREITLRLKDEVVEDIKARIGALLAAHGGTDAAYFDELRTVALEMLLELDRNLIFELQ